MKQDSGKKKQYSPYRSNSQVAAKEKAVNIVNSASATATTALKLRHFNSTTKTQARPMSARTSTPVVPKPCQKRPKSRSKERKAGDSMSHRPPAATTNLKQPATAKPPQPIRSSRKPSQGAIVINKAPSTKANVAHKRKNSSTAVVDCGGSNTTAMTHSASVPVNLQQSSSSIKSSDLASQHPQRHHNEYVNPQSFQKTVKLDGSTHSSLMIPPTSSAFSAKLGGSFSHRMVIKDDIVDVQSVANIS